ncbi:MAG: PQQ-dependent sugar dehydrogenase [Gemmatimonadota bacterium]|nr:PQQ-dependent sugar dehydrogenase [Gemmatimonadota bacterium]
MAVSASVGALNVASVVVQVSGSGIADTLVFQLAVANGVASGSITVPTGIQRTITVRAFDGGGIETHMGSITIDVVVGDNPPVAITLTSLSGSVPIVVTIGETRVMVEPALDSLTVGDTTVLAATVIDQIGDTLDVAVTWASLDPAVVTVLSIGPRVARATGVGSGQTVIVAAYGGAAGGTVVVVDSGAAPVPVLALELVTENLSSPIFVTAPVQDTTRLHIVERGGVIKVMRNDSLLGTPFLDINGRVLSGGEQGLLSLAFHPRYAQNGEFFVYYTNLNGHSHVSRFRVTADPDIADPASEDTLLVVTQPFSNHNGGLVTFGPDSMLYVGLGDGGSGGDPQGNGQNAATLLGSILRIDVDGGTPYAIPGDNPFVNDTVAAPEIWVYGLRNPWRFSFDRATGDVYIGDVGQGAWEEIDFRLLSSAGGENFGWNVMEGLHCYNAASCDQTGLTLPVLEYPHSEGCSVTGGYVYRGDRLPSLQGRYFYGDYCSGWIRSFRVEGGSAVDPIDHSTELGTLSQITSFGQDAQGEMYVVTLGGRVYRVVEQ